MSDWKDSDADLSSFSPSEAEDGPTITLTVEVYEALSMRASILRNHDRVLFRARLEDGAVVIPGTTEEVNAVRDAIAFELGLEQSRMRRQRLEEAYLAFDRAREGAG